MQTLVLLLSASLIFCNVSPSKREANPGIYAPLQSDQCHGKTYQKCFTVPKHEEYDDCVDIIDTNYVDECDHVTNIHCDEEYSHVLVHVYDSHIMTHDTYVPQCHHTKSSEECHRIPKEEVHTECKKVVKTIYIEQCEDDSLLRGCITVTPPYK